MDTVSRVILPDDVFSVVNEKYQEKYEPWTKELVEKLLEEGTFHDEHHRRLLDTAICYAKEGVPVFPVDVNKKPLIRAWPQRATTGVPQIQQWFSDSPFKESIFGIATPTGPASGLFVMDEDGEIGKRSRKALEDKHGPLPTTCVQRTGGGGRQYVFRYPVGLDIRNSASQLG